MEGGEPGSSREEEDKSGASGSGRSGDCVPREQSSASKGVDDHSERLGPDVRIVLHQFTDPLDTDSKQLVVALPVGCGVEGQGDVLGIEQVNALLAQDETGGEG
eukprot:294612-Hanusia_phi.AAC.1